MTRMRRLGELVVAVLAVLLLAGTWAARARVARLSEPTRGAH